MRVRDIALEILQTAFRLFPWPTQPGLRRVGEPGPLSPVIVTGNYDLTVRRVMRALRGVDAWLVVAPSGGINVWCAAAGGHLSTHQVVTALKTSGVEERVRHRRAILPQLAATGVQAREVSRRCRWRVRFGPVYALDLPAYLDGGERKSDDMRHVRFALAERLEMAVSWAAPTAIVAGIAGVLLRPGFAPPLVALSLLLAVALFLVYDRLPEPRRLVFGAIALGVSLAAVALGVSLAVVALAGGGPAALATDAVAVSLLVAVLTFDYPGTTPIEGGSFFEQRSWRITLDLERCQGVYSCWEVCPEACFEKRDGVRQVDLAHDDRCVRCGACVVQCPMDALYFEDERGRRVEPETIRRYKLNMMGRRAVEADAAPPPA